MNCLVVYFFGYGLSYINFVYFGFDLVICFVIEFIG